MPKERLLTKSRFKTGCECPTKLAYLGDPSYGSTKSDNSFLAALAEGGFQVGELAKFYVPGGKTIDTLEAQAALNESNTLLSEKAAVVYEPAFRFENLFVRVDIIRKEGLFVDLIEVKAKSIDPTEGNPFWKKRTREISSDWKSYLLDVAFQTYVVRQAHPEWKVTPMLMLADKSKKATVDGINQRFLITKDSRRTKVKVKPGTTDSNIGEAVLVAVDVSSEVEFILNEWIDEGLSFVQKVRHLADSYQRQKKIEPEIGSKCKTCEFRIGSTQKAQGLKSGFDECWTTKGGVSQSDLDTRTPIFEIWNYRKSSSKIAEGLRFIDQVDVEEFGSLTTSDEGLTPSARQGLQVKLNSVEDATPYIDAKGLRKEFSAWVYPLHMIDFETTMVAIPFNKGRRPYEQAAFQFSHHLIDASGKVEHKTQYINLDRGKFPNFQFVRELKAALVNDNGTIFRYATHENTVLRQIFTQLKDSKEKDRNDLCEWIDSVTVDSERNHIGPRSMVDLCDLVKRYYYHPATNGSNSIKKVLPAILSSSTFLQGLYSRPVYGSAKGISSLNFKDWTWITRTPSGEVKDPYKLLEPIFEDISSDEMEALVDGTIADGGAAMTAYARMQFAEMSDEETKAVSAALLRYCELDTFAMVMIYEYWAEAIGWTMKKKVA